MLFPILLSILMSLVHQSTAIDWQSGSNGQVMWGSNCDFYGNDIDRRPSSSEDCGGICVAYPGCTHFTWNSGFCYVKKAHYPEANDSNGAVCGWVTGSPPVISNQVTTKASFWAASSDSGGCQLPGTVSYTVTDALALGQMGNLEGLIYRPGLCGQVLSVDCGRGAVNAVVASTCNLGSSSCGVDLIQKTWNKATGNQSPGIAECKVALTNQNPMAGGAPLCFHQPNSEIGNLYYASLGVFNTNGRVVKSATLAGVQGIWNNGGWFKFNSGGSFNTNAAVSFSFEDGSSNSFSLSDCAPGGSTHIFS